MYGGSASTGYESADHEQGIVSGFVHPDRQARCLALLRTKAGRAKLRRSLAHLGWFDPARSYELPSSTDADGVLRALSACGAPPVCYVLSESTKFDGRTMPLVEAIDALFASGIGSVLSCIPGQLGYFESEDFENRCFLGDRVRLDHCTRLLR